MPSNDVDDAEQSRRARPRRDRRQALIDAAIELIAEAGIDMHGVAAGDLEGMSSRARAALVAASVPNEPRVSDE